MRLPCLLHLFNYSVAVLCHCLLQMLRNLHQSVIHTSAALGALGAYVASEPEARLIAALVQLNA